MVIISAACSWWCNNHLEKRWSSSMGRIIYPIYEMENKIPWFETTNQTFISGGPGSS